MITLGFWDKIKARITLALAVYRVKKAVKFGKKQVKQNVKFQRSYEKLSKESVYEHLIKAGLKESLDELYRYYIVVIALAVSEENAMVSMEEVQFDFIQGLGDVEVADEKTTTE